MKAGKYTAALVLLSVGTALLVDVAADTAWTAAVIKWWPAALIALGVEYMIVSMRSRDEKTGIAFGSLALAAGISVAAIAVSHAGAFFPGNWVIQLGNVSFADESGRRFEMEPVRTAVDDRTELIYLFNHNGNVTLRTDDVDELEVEGTVFVPQAVDNAEEIARASGIRLEQKGNRLELLVQGKEYRHFGVRQRPRINLTVTVPRDLDPSWHLDLTNGKVDAAGLTVRDRLAADTTNGSVELRDIDGNVTADTTNGNVTIRDIRGDVTADTTNGRVSIENVGGNAFADTTHGQVQMRDVAGEAWVDTTNGSVILERIGGDVKAETTNGSIRLTGAGGAVEAGTTNGDITIRTDTLAGNYRLDSANGSINVHLPRDASFEVSGESTWGHVRTDFDLSVDKRAIRGSVNGGRYEIKIDTNAGIGIHAN